MKIETLLFSGCGVKVLSYFGILKYIKQNKDIELSLSTVGGVSAGAIFSLFLVLGIDLLKVEKELLEIDFHKCLTFKTRYLRYYGLNNGKIIMQHVEKISTDYCKFFKKDTTFKELYEKTNIQYDVYATNLTTKQLFKFNHLTTPNMIILNAIRLSISIPIIFTIKKYKEDIYVDAGIVNNFPYEEYYIDGKCPDTFYGFLTSKKSKSKINSFINYITSLINTITSVKCKEKNMFYIETTESSLNFKLKKQDKLNLIQQGYNKMEEIYLGIVENPNTINFSK